MPGALQRTSGAWGVRCGSLTHPESRREQQHPPGCVAALFPIGQRTLSNTPQPPGTVPPRQRGFQAGCVADAASKSPAACCLNCGSLPDEQM